MSVDDYNALFSAQGGVCCICEKREEGNPYGVLEVEHKPGTKQVRGLVCHPCNNLIMYYENAAKSPHLAKIMAYLKRNE